MDIRQMRYFQKIIEEKQITKAAKILHVAQPALSLQLKQLEEELGVPLIIRDGKKWEVTEAGQFLYQQIKTLLESVNNIKNEISEMKEGLSGTVAIGTSTICVSHLAEHLTHFHRKYPNVYLRILNGDTHHQEKLLRENKIDIALLLLPVEGRNYEIIPLNEDPFIAVIPKKWESQFPQNSISLEEIASKDLLLIKRTTGIGIYERVLKHFQQYNYTPNVIMDCPDITTILTLVATGMGMTIIPKSEIHQAYEGSFKLLEISEPFLFAQPAIVWIKGKYISKAAKELINLLTPS
jgi:DNA-binding transcriptional LysR family regulator